MPVTKTIGVTSFFLAKTEKTANEEKTTTYAYGLERIAAYGPNQKTTYVYDGRGSVAKTISTLKAGETQEQNFLYTAFGEQMGMQKVSGFGYNAEAYDAATGMINLRARQYEPIVTRFVQKDIYHGILYLPDTINSYLYCLDSPVIFVDPSGAIIAPFDRGRYHREVQRDIVNKNKGIIANEISVFKYGRIDKRGRIDLLNYITGETWEVKPMGVTYRRNPINYEKKAKSQLQS